MIAILDYGSGNIKSAQRAFSRHGAQVEVTNDFQKCVNADGLVIPGVGAFATCMEGLLKHRADAIIDARMTKNLQTLGICVGAQTLFSFGDEHDVVTPGLGQWNGTVTKLPAPKLPHMGWNLIDVAPESALFAGVEKERFYFVHSFAAQNWEEDPHSPLKKAKVSWSNYGGKFIAAVENGPLSATQFHPEKSGDAGAKLIENWIVKCA